MSKLTKAQAKAHKEAMALVDLDRPLSWDERCEVLDKYQEGATHMNGLAGAFFTPRGLATCLAIEVVRSNDKRKVKVLDLCAGIGGLSYACQYGGYIEFTCVEYNPEYVRVGKKIMPDANWVVASIFDTEAYKQFGPFDVVMGNPPFGNIPAEGHKGKYTGSRFELKCIELASQLARDGVFIVPQGSAPFRYSGMASYTINESDELKKFREQTGIVMGPSCGIDTSVYRNEWHGTSPATEIVVCDFAEPDPSVVGVKDAQATRSVDLPVDPPRPPQPDAGLPDVHPGHPEW